MAPLAKVVGVKRWRRISATNAKKAELMLLYDANEATRRLIEIIRMVVNTGEQPEMRVRKAFWNGYGMDSGADC